MNLFYHPGACSLAVHIALAEAQIPYNLVGITLDKRTADGRDFLAINPKGFIPALEHDDGTVIAEALAILVYIADRASVLLPKEGLGRWKTLEATSFMTTEVHGNFKPFWKRASDPEKERARALLAKHFATLAAQLGEQPFLLGEKMTIADLYLYVMRRWAAHHGVDVPAPIAAFATRMETVPSVARALTEEGLS